jgi:hypothetical protein
MAKRGTKKRGGAATSYPAKYFGMPGTPSADGGHDILGVTSNMIRPKIGGKRRSHRRQTKKKGGFLPSIGEPFVALVSKFITPLVFYSGYKFLTRKQAKSGKKHTRRHSRK